MTSRWPPLEDLAEARAPDARATPVDATPTPPIAIGNVIAGKYRVDRVIGFGGMGIVCAATHLELGTPIAIKFVRPERASDERAAARFLTEARAAAQLQSQFACRVMDCGRLPTGNPYIVMEHLTGEDLRRRVDTRGPLEIEEAVLLALHACEALAEAHSKHIVHRDVKPENLFIAEGPGGAPLLKVLDFGISKQLTPLTAPRALTDSSESMGSPFHMSPEQMLEPANVDSRTDIWALGVVLYEVLTGQLPFAGQTAPQLCANVMTTQPLSPQAHRADIPDELSRVILKCLEKDRELRFRDVGALSLALKDFAGPAGALAAAHVETILGRTPSTEPPHLEAPASEQAAPSVGTPGAIPGVPRRGFGLRVGVAVVLTVATAMAVFAVRRAATPAPLEPAPKPLPAPLPTPSAQTPTAPTLPLPSATVLPSASAKRPARKPKTVAAPPGAPSLVREAPVAVPEAPAPVPDAPAPVPEAPLVEPPPAQGSSVVYPSLTPLPELPPPPP